MDKLRHLIMENEEWLMRRILHYAKEHDYVKYTSTLLKAWRISIENLSSTIITAIECEPRCLEFDPDESYELDPIASFGIEEAKKHRARGLTLGMFLSLFKYYRQCYIDLVQENDLPSPARKEYEHLINRCFDRIELGLCTEWSVSTDHYDELQTSNRFLANEKNKYLTIFESLHDPVILLDYQGRVTNMNHAAAKLFIGEAVPGDLYYNETYSAPSILWIQSELEAFHQKEQSTYEFEKTLQTSKGIRFFEIKFEKMLDISEKYAGVVVLLNDLTESKRAIIMEERERLARELHDSVTQSLYSLSLFAEWGDGLLEVGDVKQARDRMGRIGEVSRQAQREMRLLLYELRPSALEEDGLAGALQSRLAAVEQRVGVKATLKTEIGVDLTPHVEECLYRISQEALNNALKHAGAKHVSVTLNTDQNGILLEINDDGTGFIATQKQSEGKLGLHNMRTRTEELGGTFDLVSYEGEGTTVRVRISATANAPVPFEHIAPQ